MSSESLENDKKEYFENDQIKLGTSKKIDKHARNKWNAVVFGECGQGKSTVLSKIAQIFADNFCDPGSHASHFASK